MRALNLSRLIPAALAALATALTAPLAWGYCRSNTCVSDGNCPLASPDCKELYWGRPCVGIAIQQDGTSNTPLAQVHEVLQAAFSTWEDAPCPNGKPGIVVQDLGDVSCAKVEYSSDAGNTNIVVFRDDKWPDQNKSNQLALTTVTFNPDTGEIYDADMEVNSADWPLNDVASLPADAVPGPKGFNDLLSVITHEAGHFLGLAHTTDPQATMHASYKPNGDGREAALEFRTIEQDDIAGICSIYPPASVDPATCNPIPRHGFASDCVDTQIVGCSVAHSVSGDAAAAPTRMMDLGLLGATAALVAIRRHERRRSARRS